MPIEYETLGDFQNALQHAISDASAEDPDAMPERVALALIFSQSALLPIDMTNQAVPSQNPEEDAAMTGSYKQVYDLCNIDDLQERQRWQRGAARGILSAIRDVDGFKYSVNNIWTSKDDKGFRFSWNCLDSRENKDRHANSLNNGTESLDSPTGPVRIRKETFDCRGHVAVKFSGKRYVVEVVYKHTAMHPSVADRAPPPRVRPRGRPRKDQSTTAVYGGTASSLNGSTASTPVSYTHLTLPTKRIV